jgi:hypothetical protein
MLQNVDIQGHLMTAHEWANERATCSGRECPVLLNDTYVKQRKSVGVWCVCDVWMEQQNVRLKVVGTDHVAVRLLSHNNLGL